jgi:hypothetical protein
MHTGAVVRLVLGSAAAPALYLVVWNLGFIASLLLGVPQPWQLLSLLMLAALAGALAGLTMERAWSAGLKRANWHYPRWQRRGIVCLWTILGLVPPLFPFPGRPSLVVACTATLLALLAIVGNRRRATRSEPDP